MSLAGLRNPYNFMNRATGAAAPLLADAAPGDALAAAEAVAAAQRALGDKLKEILLPSLEASASGDANDTATQRALGDKLQEILLPALEVYGMKGVSHIINSKSNDGETPLFIAAKNGHWDAARSLLRWGADATIQNTDGETPRSIATKNGHDNVLHALRQGQTPREAADELFVAAEKGDLSVVKRLLDEGGPGHWQVDDVQENGMWPLLVAAAGGHKDVVEALLDKGAVVNKRRLSDGATALSMAAQNEHAIVGLLLDKGAKVDTEYDVDHPARKHVKYVDATNPMHVAALDAQQPQHDALGGGRRCRRKTRRRKTRRRKTRRRKIRRRKTRRRKTHSLRKRKTRQKK
jgi:hypothetical protein